jgi:hypothetical protein
MSESMSDSSSTWSVLLSDLQPEQNLIFVASESDFRREFEKLCSRLREPDPQRLLGKFFRHHAQIMVFIGALDESSGLSESNNSLGSLFWSFAFTIIRVRPDLSP